MVSRTFCPGRLLKGRAAQGGPSLTPPSAATSARPRVPCVGDRWSGSLETLTNFRVGVARTLCPESALGVFLETTSFASGRADQRDPLLPVHGRAVAEVH